MLAERKAWVGNVWKILLYIESKRASCYPDGMADIAGSVVAGTLQQQPDGVLVCGENDTGEVGDGI